MDLQRSLTRVLPGQRTQHIRPAHMGRSIRGSVVFYSGLLITSRCQVECAGYLGQTLHAGFNTAVFMQ